jgi:hypothetical protein
MLLWEEFFLFLRCDSYSTSGKLSPGIPGRFSPEWVADLKRRPWQISPGMSNMVKRNELYRGKPQSQLQRKMGAYGLI